MRSTLSKVRKRKLLGAILIGGGAVGVTLAVMWLVTAILPTRFSITLGESAGARSSHATVRSEVHLPIENNGGGRIVVSQADKRSGDGDAQGDSTPQTRAPSSLVARDRPVAILHTNYGDIVWELFPEDAPKTVANIIRMSREGVFNQSCFYRYEKGFVLQGGLHCNKPPPHHGKAKNVPLEYKRRNEKYTVALARAGSDLNSGGTEFFINLRDNSGTLGPGKKGGYAVFAAVVDGLDVIAALKKLPTKTAGLTRFVSPQPVIVNIEIRNYDDGGAGAAGSDDDAKSEDQTPRKTHKSHKNSHDTRRGGATATSAD